MRFLRLSMFVVGVCLVLPRAGRAQDCAWRPWAASWSTLEQGNDLFPPNKIYNPTNWDYLYSQTQNTFLNMPKDTPPGGGVKALHVFFDAVPQSSYRSGSGGVYQQITVQPGVPLHYSFWWKGKCADQSNWFEFSLIDGPFNLVAADTFSENQNANNPATMHKKSLFNTQFGWENLTDASPAESGPAGPRPTTITPTGTTVTIGLKIGHAGSNGRVEGFFDNIFVSQDGVTNLVVNGDFEDAQQGAVCDGEYMSTDSTQQGYWFGRGQCPFQHTTTIPVNPATHDNVTNTTLTITGTRLEYVTQAKLVPVGGGAEIVATSITPTPATNATSLTAVFPTAGKTDGYHDVVTVQAAPCLTKTLANAFRLTCPNAATITAVSPTSVTDPGAGVVITLSGTNLNQLTGVRLDNPAGNIIASTFAMNGADLQTTFDLSCKPVGQYRVVGLSNCQPANLDPGLLVLKTSPPAQACAWLPWAAAWSRLNTGVDINPPNQIYNPTNWDYSLSQTTLNGTLKDTPPGVGGSYALHWFLDAQPTSDPPGTTSNGLGSGGVYQQITVQPGVPLKYSYWWKGASNGGPTWYEFMLIDGPFSIGMADAFAEGATANNPYLIHKRSSDFAWEQVTDQTAADIGPAGAQPTTITPTSNVVTIVLKAGRSTDGAIESFFDNVSVWQGTGSNLVVNGDFENASPLRAICDNASMFKDSCEANFWRWSSFTPLPPCPIPFADANSDGYVDMIDFAIFQTCMTIGGTTATVDCHCFDRVDPINQIDGNDFAAFQNCVTGPGVLFNINSPPPGCTP